MDSASRGLGYKGASPKVVAEFAQEMRKLFPETIPKTGLTGSLKLGVGDILESISKTGAPNLTDQQKAVRELINSYLTNSKNTIIPKTTPKAPVSATKSQISKPSAKNAPNDVIPKSSIKPVSKSSKLSPKGQGEIPKTNSAKEAVAKGLTEEITKFKSADDFIADKTKTVFIEDSKGFTMEIPKIDADNLNLKSNEFWHGSTGKLFETFKPGRPVFMTKDSGFANYYPKQQKNSNYAKVFKVTVPENARFFDATKDASKLMDILPEKVELGGLFGARKTISRSEFVNGLKNESAWSEFELSSAGGKPIIKYIKEAGFDGVKMKEMGDDTFALFSPSKAKTTTSQLRTEYQKALKASKK